MLYKSTRGTKEVEASTAILNGIAEAGGLYMPTEIPTLTKSLGGLSTLSYQSLCYEILKLYYTDFTAEELKDCISKAYNDTFDTPLIAPLVKAGEQYILELFHGKTSAFKDMALSLHPHLMKTAAKKSNVEKKIIILTATSGDTGKAALEGFANVSGIDIVVLYPVDGVSEVQKLQMTTQKGSNTHVVAIEGNFDDAQTAVKEIFNDSSFCSLFNEKGYIFSSANSINIGRLFPQIVYYFYAYFQMVNKCEIKLGDAINFSVPTGNFGNILAGYYAYRMGLPVNNFICASNTNNVLCDFFNTGKYDINREFILTTSPSMDILISSNLERFLYTICQNSEEINNIMTKLNTEGKYRFDLEKTNIYAEYATENEVFDTLLSTYEKDGYIFDTHTAVAKAAYDKYKSKTSDNTKTVIVSTAHPAKFAKAVLSALKIDKALPYDDFSCIDQLENDSDYSLQIPEPIKQLKQSEILHKAQIKKGQLHNYLQEMFL